jgi:hypothetical protein
MSEKLKTYKVKVKYTFTGTVYVQAESKERAKFIVEHGFGGVHAEVGKSSWVLNDIKDKTEEGIKDWDIETTPTDTKIS